MDSLSVGPTALKLAPTDQRMFFLVACHPAQPVQVLSCLQRTAPAETRAASSFS